MSKTKSLRFAENTDGELVELPLSMLMQTIFIGGNKGAGKTSAMKRLFEAAHKAGAQCGVIAPLGRWWSLRIARNGRGRGLKDVFVFGGKHGDVAISATSGRQIARTVATKRIHFVLDVELMRKEDRAQFLGDFLEELWQLKKEEDASHPMVLFIDEAQVVAPQKSTSKLVERMREFAADLCREGRNHGVGMVLGAQRSANVDKDLLALVEMLIVMRTIHHLDRKVYQSWVDEKSERDDDEGAWLKRLRRLEKGQAYLYAPELNVFERVNVLLPDTYDATKTATLGEKVARIGKLSKLDVRRLGEELSAVVAETEANDPTKLRVKIRELETKLAAKTVTSVVAGAVIGAVGVKKVQPLKVDKRTLRRVERAAKDGRTVIRAIEKLVTKLVAARESFADGAKLLDVREKLPVIRPGYAIGVSKDSATPVRVLLDEKAKKFGERYNADPKKVFDAAKLNAAARGFLKSGTHPLEARGAAKFEAFKNGEAKLGKGERIIMSTIAQHTEGITREALTVITGYKRSTRNAYVFRLLSAGYVQELPDERLVANAAGTEWLGADYKPLPTGDALREHWLTTLPSGERKILGELVNVYPSTLERSTLDEKTGFKRTTRNAYIFRLIKRQLVFEHANGGISASETLFQESV